MKLELVKLRRFRSIVSEQTVQVEEDVTCLVGKNESGKTTILQALHRLNPANVRDSKFDLVTEYPRWRLAPDRKAENLDAFQPIETQFALDAADITACAAFLPSKPPMGTKVIASMTYGSTLIIALRCALDLQLREAAKVAEMEEKDAEPLVALKTREEAIAQAKATAKGLGEGEKIRSKTFSAFVSAADTLKYLALPLTQEQVDALVKLIPKFFYFSDVDILPGEHDLTALADKTEAKTKLTAEDESVEALLSYSGVKPVDFLGANYDQRKAELQASALDLTRKVFNYWTQNRDLSVDFDTELEEVGKNPDNSPIMHRFLKVLMRDERHGGIVTNFKTRSAGFQWFFSFLAAFSKYLDSKEPVIVLLDEPGTSLHGEAQKDFLKFIFSELGKSKQVLYTTHSQYMVDPARYEKLRAVEDRSTRENPDLGVVIGDVRLTTDADTLLPIQAALGYSISQHLFIGSGRNLIVEGGSDFVYLMRMSEYLFAQVKTGLDPRLKIVPVGSASNMPAFVALIGRDLEVSVLLDGARSGKDAQRVLALVDGKLITKDEIVVIADIQSAVTSPDIEDLFDVDDYLRLYNWAFDKKLKAADLPNNTDRIIKRIEAVAVVFDHALSAHALTAHRDEFFKSVASGTVERFEKLFAALNATIPK